MSSFAERHHQVAYGKSAKLSARENQSDDFRAGYARGLTRSKGGGLDILDEEWLRRGSPQPCGLGWHAYCEFKRGYWAGSFTALNAPKN